MKNGTYWHSPFIKATGHNVSNFGYPKYFFALCRTRVSNTLLLIGVCAVWKGLIIVYEGSTFLMVYPYSRKNRPLHTTPRHPWRTTSSHRHSSLRATRQTSYLVESINQYSHNKNNLVLTSWCDKCRYRPFVEFVYRLEIPVKVPLLTGPSYTTINTHIVFSLRITSSITSRLALAIIWMTCLSCPPPIRTGPPVVCWGALEAPDNALSVPAKADVDQVGRLVARGDVTLTTGFVDWCVRLYNGVSEGDSRKRWCDIIVDAARNLGFTVMRSFRLHCHAEFQYTMSQSLSPECTPLKQAYDTCFNSWFEGYLEPAVSASSSSTEARAEYSKKKAEEFQGKCGKIWESYRSCIQVCMDSLSF